VNPKIFFGALLLLLGAGIIALMLT
jgi:hypothetical protein